MRGREDEHPGQVPLPGPCHPTLPPARARLIRVDHEYDRRGAVAYIAAYDVHRSQVFGRCEDTTRIAPFGRLVEQAMTREPSLKLPRRYPTDVTGALARLDLS